MHGFTCAELGGRQERDEHFRLPEAHSQPAQPSRTDGGAVHLPARRAHRGTRLWTDRGTLRTPCTKSMNYLVKFSGKLKIKERKQGEHKRWT